LKYLLGALLLLNIADAVTTNFIIKLGLGREGNPFLLDVVGQPYFIVLKVAGVLFCCFILWDIHRRQPKLALAVTSCCVIAYAVIVSWNLAILLR